MKTVVHVTHEAVQKIGGIGAVLHGLLTVQGLSRRLWSGTFCWARCSRRTGRRRGGWHGGEVLYSGGGRDCAHPYAGMISRRSSTTTG